jgi:hypothetical protein
MSAETIPDLVAISLQTLQSDQHLFRKGLAETADTVVRSRELIVRSREVLRQVDKVWQRLPSEKIASALRPPVCPGCHTQMHYETSELDKINSQLRHVMFKCDCGRKSDQLVAPI